MSNALLPEPFPGHEHGVWAPVKTSMAASWPAPSFAENLAVNTKGEVFISLHSHNRVDRYNPVTGKTETFAQLPGPATGLAFSADGTLWVTGGTPGTAPGFIWRINPNGTAEEWLQIPDAVFLNGCTPLGDGKTLLVCESATGRVLAINQQTASCDIWLEDEQLISNNAQTPGANGIKIFQGHAWISVTDRNLLLRVPLGANATPKTLEVVAENLRADDFAFAASGNVYIATHPAQSILRLSPDGTRITIAGPQDGAVGSTSCAFGRFAGDETALYVTTSGGLFSPYQGKVQDAKLLRLEVGEPGLPLLSP